MAELLSFFDARKCRFKIVDLSKSFFVIISESALAPSLIDDLGGMIKIGRITSEIPMEAVKEAFSRGKKQAQAEIWKKLSAGTAVNEIFAPQIKKRVFGVSLYFDCPHFRRFSKKIQRSFGNYFKRELAAQGVKAKFMGFPRDRKLPQLTHVEVLKRNLVKESAEILLGISRTQMIVAKTISVHNPFEFEKRDVNRPIQRKIFSIPPRLAKIMANFSSCMPNKVLLDPFCGVGTILQEAVLMKAQVMGVDINPWCVEASRINLEWLKHEYALKDVVYRILLGDAKELVSLIGGETVDCIVTEPDLGPALRHLPTEQYAKKIIGKLKSLYCDFLNAAYEILKKEGRLVLVEPYIKTRSNVFVSLDIGEHARMIGFKNVCPFRGEQFANNISMVEELVKTVSFVDMERRHKIGRAISIFEK